MTVALEDIQHRYLASMDTSNAYKIFTRIEQALWHYADFHAENNEVKLRNFPITVLIMLLGFTEVQ